MNEEYFKQTIRKFVDAILADAGFERLQEPHCVPRTIAAKPGTRKVKSDKTFREWLFEFVDKDDPIRLYPSQTDFEADEWFEGEREAQYSVFFKIVPEDFLVHKADPMTHELFLSLMADFIQDEDLTWPLRALANFLIAEKEGSLKTYQKWTHQQFGIDTKTASYIKSITPQTMWENPNVTNIESFLTLLVSYVVNDAERRGIHTKENVLLS